MAAAIVLKGKTKEHVSLKLLVNEDTNKVLFAVAGKDFADALCSFLTLPLGTIARLTRKESNIGPVTVGCLNSLYQSVKENLDEECLQTVVSKALLLQPSESYCKNLKLNIDDNSTQPKKYFTCAELPYCNFPWLSSFKNQRCQCGSLLNREVLIEPSREGFVNNGATVVITDNLTVMANSMDCTVFALLQKFGVKSTRSLKEMTVNVTKEKVLDLLKCSLFSKTTLTHTFLRKNPLLELSRFSPCDVHGSGSRIEINLKLVIRKSDGKIMYAQGEEDFAEFLFSFLACPLGAVIRLLGGNSSLGSVDELYKSIADLKANKYLLSEEAKNKLVDPRLRWHLKLRNQILPTYQPRYLCYYQCSTFRESILNNELCITDEYKGNGESNVAMSYINPGSSAGSNHKGGVKKHGIYVATDDLVVRHLSPISSVDLLNRLGTPLSDLEEKAVTIGIKECFSILKASLTTTSALTNGLSHLLTKIKEEK